MPNSRPTSSQHAPQGLPPSLKVPPVPQAVHRSLFVSSAAEGLIVRPSSSSSSGASTGKGAIRIEWGPKGKVEQVNDQEESRKEEAVEKVEEQDEAVEVEIRGILGTLRLWSTAYLLVIVDPKSVGHFPSAAHEVFCLNNVQAIPLTKELADKALLAIQRSAQAKQAPAPSPSDAAAPEGSDLDDAARAGVEGHDRVRWGEVVTPGKETPRDSSSDEDDESESDGEAGSSASADKQSLKKDKKRISLNPFFKWNPFVPKPNSTSSATSTSTHPTPASATDPFALPADLPTPTSPPTSSGTPPLPLLPSALTLPIPADPSGSSTTPAPTAAHVTRSHLETKILTSLITLFTSGQMFFSYTHDLTNSLAAKADKGNVEMLPLWRRVDRRFWWNEWLGREMIDQGLHPFILPVMQGWVQITTLNIPHRIVPAATPAPASADGSATIEEETPPTPVTIPVDFVVISRRSRDRAGLRFQRRGLDDEGNVANFNETEQIVRAENHVFSYVQVRGSIPLFWSQSPYSSNSAAYALKPAPVLDRPLPIARGPMAVHFDELTKRYGKQTVVNLSEQTGKEGIVTKGFGEVLGGLKREDVEYKEFDFHEKCKGMKFENVSLLIDELDSSDTFLKQGYYEAGGPDGRSRLQAQKGAFRTNCVDCLDRTNVVQSALARHVLGIQLASIGLAQSQDLKGDVETVFNDVWANNGDAISRCYAGTSALKGDFTRTGKRNLQGMINDGLNSISRMYTSAFSDFFSQAVISFMLGQRSLAVFTEFVEKLQVAEPANLLRLAVVRSEAVETCSARVLSDGETRVSGWTLFAPTEMNVKAGQEFEEKVLLLTKKAIYVCRYEYELEKVVGFTRIPLGNVVSLQRGAYILSPLQEAGQDVEENYGFKISFRGSDDETRLASYSMRNQIGTTTTTTSSSPRPKSLLKPLRLASLNKPSASPPTTGSSSPVVLTNKPVAPQDEIKFFAFKAIPRDVVLHGRELSSVDRSASSHSNGVDGEEEDEEKTCKEVVKGITERLKVLCGEAGSGWDSPEGGRFLKEEDIIGLEEAQAMTPWTRRLEHGVKRWLWL